MVSTFHAPKYPVQTLEKALDIIGLLAKNNSNKGLGISEMSRQLGIGKSTVHRILDTLMAYDYVEKCPESTSYRLAWSLFEIGNIVPLQHSLLIYASAQLTLSRSSNHLSADDWAAKDLAITVATSALVISLFGLKLPSPYPPIIPSLCNVSTLSLLQ